MFACKSEDPSNVGFQRPARDLTIQEMCWDRGRPARHERKARKDQCKEIARLVARLRAGRPRYQHIT